MLPSIAANVLGFPALAVPLHAAGAQPMGIQLLADRFDESLLFKAARDLEARRGPVSVVDPSPGSDPREA